MDTIYRLLLKGLSEMTKSPKITMEQDAKETFINIENTIFLFEDKDNPEKIIRLEYVDKDTNEFIELHSFKTVHELDVIIQTLECYFKFFILSNIEEDYWTTKND